MPMLDDGTLGFCRTARAPPPQNATGPPMAGLSWIASQGLDGPAPGLDQSMSRKLRSVSEREG